jgi:hypothetical protein
MWIDIPSPQKGKLSLKGLTPDSWNCVDCGANTAPGLKSRAEMEKAFAADLLDQGVKCRIGCETEVYYRAPSVFLSRVEFLKSPSGACLRRGRQICQNHPESTGHSPGRKN